MEIKKVVLITGSSEGIGKALAEGFAGSGYAVALNGRSDTPKIQSVVHLIQKTGGIAQVFAGDISKQEQVFSIIEGIINTWGHIDVLINNAGHIQEQLLPNLDEEIWDDVLRVNLKGVFLCTKAVSRHMIKQHAGAVINIGSIQGMRGGYGTAAYAASKGGVISFTKTAAQELGKRGITVNAVLPGYHRTNMENIHYEEKAKKISVLGSTPDIKEFVEFVVLLARMKTISGQVFNWDSRII